MARFSNINKTAAKVTEQNTSDFKPYLLVGIASICCYLNSLFGEFVYDDYEVIETNADVRPSSPLSSLFTNDFWGIPIQSNESHKSYRPITILTFRWNYLIGGLNPFGYHAINVLLHSAVSVFFLCFCKRLFNTYIGSPNRSLPVFCGLFFALHPIHTEAVSNVVGRADVLCGLFYLLTLLSYINCFPDGSSPNRHKVPSKYSRLWLASSIFCCVLSLFSKEQGITVLGVCVVLDIVLVGKVSGGYLLKAIATPIFFFRSCPKWFVCFIERVCILVSSAIILLYLRIVIINRGLAVSFTESDNPTSFHPDVWTRFRTYSYLCSLNARLLLCPNILCYDWSMDSISRIESWWDMRNAESLVFTLIMAWLCFYGLKPLNDSTLTTDVSNKCDVKSTTFDSNKNTLRLNDNKRCEINESRMNLNKNWEDFGAVDRKRVVLLSLGMLIIPFLPASNLFFPVGFVVAERILYVPSMGICILVPFGILVLFRPTKKRRNTEEASVAEDHKKQSNVDKETSVTSTYLSLGDNMAHMLIYALLFTFVFKVIHRNSEWTTKERLARSGLKVNPRNAKIHVTLGNVLARKGHLSCEYHYRKALRLRPHYVTAWENLGLVLLNTGRAQEAEECYLKALSIKPNSADGNINLAHLLRVTGRLPEADVQYRQALSLRPNHPQLNYFHGVVLEKLGKIKAAEEKYLKASKLMPSDAMAFVSLGKMFAISVVSQARNGSSKKFLKKAEEYLQKGLQLKPSDTESRLLLVQLYLLKNKFYLAESEVRTVLKYDANSKEAEFLMGRILELKGLFKEARKHYYRVLKKDHQHGEAMAALQRLSSKVWDQY
ncbi:protein O-mannosyl-transferase TMTC4-like [Montipora foliosa]|uniref:protein O-mannosyl-transferase TMTC4-like n=1 Tax=Montipora foliosa TaxID=591990 RepID=UPI0035F1F30A